MAITFTELVQMVVRGSGVARNFSRGAGTFVAWGWCVGWGVEVNVSKNILLCNNNAHYPFCTVYKRHFYALRMVAHGAVEFSLRRMRKKAFMTNPKRERLP